jgi:hypothetical protein
MIPERVHDESGTLWLPGPSLGHGAVAEAWQCSRASDGSAALLRVPLRREGIDVDALLSQRLDLLPTQPGDVLPALLGRGRLPSGRPFAVVEDVGPALEDLRGIEGLALLRDGCRALASLHGRGRIHGNVRATNLHRDRDGKARWSDPSPLPEAAATLHPLGPPAAPPAGEREASDADLYGLCWVLGRWLAPELELHSDTWLDRAQLDAITLAAADWARALAGDVAASRFGTATRRMVNRACSQRRDPSPPYRFHDAVELADRLDDLLELVRPSRIKLGDLRPEWGTTTRVGRPLTLSLRASGSELLGQPEHLGLGTRITLLDSDRSLKGMPVQCDVEEEKPGRVRYHFRMTPVEAGMHRLTVVLRPAGLEPILRSCNFEVTGQRAVRPAEVAATAEPPEDELAAKLAAERSRRQREALEQRPMHTLNGDSDEADEVDEGGDEAGSNPFDDGDWAPRKVDPEGRWDPEEAVERLAARARFEDALSSGARELDPAHAVAEPATRPEPIEEAPQAPIPTETATLSERPTEIDPDPDATLLRDPDAPPIVSTAGVDRPAPRPEVRAAGDAKPQFMGGLFGRARELSRAGWLEATAGEHPHEATDPPRGAAPAAEPTSEAAEGGSEADETRVLLRHPDDTVPTVYSAPEPEPESVDVDRPMDGADAPTVEVTPGPQPLRDDGDAETTAVLTDREGGPAAAAGSDPVDPAAIHPAPGDAKDDSLDAGADAPDAAAMAPADPDEEIDSVDASVDSLEEDAVPTVLAGGADLDEGPQLEGEPERLAAPTPLGSANALEGDLPVQPSLFATDPDLAQVPEPPPPEHHDPVPAPAADGEEAPSVHGAGAAEPSDADDADDADEPRIGSGDLARASALAVAAVGAEDDAPELAWDAHMDDDDEDLSEAPTAISEPPEYATDELPGLPGPPTDGPEPSLDAPTADEGPVELAPTGDRAQPATDAPTPTASAGDGAGQAQTGGDEPAAAPPAPREEAPAIELPDNDGEEPAEDAMDPDMVTTIKDEWRSGPRGPYRHIHPSAEQRRLRDADRILAGNEDLDAVGSWWEQPWVLWLVLAGVIAAILLLYFRG